MGLERLKWENLLFPSGLALLMSSPLYSVLNLFESPRGYLAEIARPPCPGPESEWVWIEWRHAITLQPIASGEGLIFEEGILWLDGRHTGTLPSPLRGLLELHLT